MSSLRTREKRRAPTADVLPATTRKRTKADEDGAAVRAIKLAAASRSKKSSATTDTSARASSSTPAASSSAAAAISSPAVTIPPNSIQLRYMPDFLTASECAHIISVTHDKFVRSTTQGGVVNPIRTSFSSYLNGVAGSDSILQAVARRVARLAGTPVSHVEELAVVRYEPDQFYGPHHDTSTTDDNPRRYTVLVYLNDAEGEGGETDFPQLDIRVKPKRGAALFWHNFTSGKVLLQESLHQGLPPISGVKYAMNGWVHDAPMDKSVCSEADTSPSPSPSPPPRTKPRASIRSGDSSDEDDSFADDL